MNATKTVTFYLQLHGHEYTVETNRGVIVACACKGRWPLTDVKLVGDEWLVGELQNAVDRRQADEDIYDYR
jgi:hypothetical protein